MFCTRVHVHISHLWDFAGHDSFSDTVGAGSRVSSAAMARFNPTWEYDRLGSGKLCGVGGMVVLVGSPEKKNRHVIVK
jgi:hypothetical protein